jgi:TM2 domain-containing membrane protein YozV
MWVTLIELGIPLILLLIIWIIWPKGDTPEKPNE